MSLASPNPRDWPPSDGPLSNGALSADARDGDLGDALTAERAARLAWLCDSPDGADADDGKHPQYRAWAAPDWWQVLPAAEQAHPIEVELPPAVIPEAIDAGFTHRDGGHGTGFEAGGALDLMLPGPELAWHMAEVQRDLGALPDDALIGALCANRRQLSWHAALEHKLVAELDSRRAQADGREGEHVDAELGAALTLTPRSAQTVLEYARQLQRLPMVLGLLAAGVIDAPRAEVIARHLESLSDEHAAKVQDLILPLVADMTTGRLGAALKTAIRKVDPDAARRRKEKALQDARVECWSEDAGTASLAGRDLPPAEVLAADKRIDAAARWLKTRGAEGTLEQLRAKVFLALLNGQPLETLLPEAAPGTAAADTADGDRVGTSGTGDGTQQVAGRDAHGAGQGSQDTGAPSSGGCGWPDGLTGSVHLTMPASAWLGRTEDPGEVGGFGAADADTCRELAARLAAGKARWCITLTDRDGRPVGHGCARAGPPARGDPTSWFATVKITPIETGTCAHRHEVPGYRIPDSLRHLIKVRSRRCGFPGCRRPAIQCDDDHTIPYHLGGRSCECNLHPLCRRHHRCKQAPGWQLDQPEPGRLTWTSPSGRTYVTTAEPYAI
jgi:hypothetical protein